MRRMNTGFFDGMLSLPGGHVEPGESVSMAAIREAGEELAIDIAPGQLGVVGVMHRLSDTNRIDFFVRASHWRGELRSAEPQKCSELAWASTEQLPPDVVPYVVVALNCAQAEPWLLECGWPAP